MARKHREKHTIELNLTSLMDIVFQLIIFFILVTNFAAAELPELEPPDPTESTATDPGEIQKVMVNIVPSETAPGMARHLIVRGRTLPPAPAGYQQVTEILTDAREANPDLQVMLRADKRLRFEQIQPVMQAVTRAGIARLNLVSLVDTDD